MTTEQKLRYMEDIIVTYRVATKALCDTLAILEAQKSEETTPRGMRAQFKFLADRPELLTALNLEPQLSSLYQGALEKENEIRKKIAGLKPIKDQPKKSPMDPRRDGPIPTNWQPKPVPRYQPDKKRKYSAEEIKQICQSKRTAPKKVNPPPRKQTTSESSSSENAVLEDLITTDSEEEILEPTSDRNTGRRPIPERTDKFGRENTQSTSMPIIIEAKPMRKSNR